MTMTNADAGAAQMVEHQSNLTSRLIDAATSFIVSALSFALLLYVGYGESRRTYEQFQIEKLVGQAELIQDSMESFLRNGYQIRQFAGFSTLAEPILSTDSSIARLGVIDHSGQTVFEAGEGKIKLLTKLRGTPTDRFELREDWDRVQVVLPLKNRFEKVGNVVITMLYAKLDARVSAAFQPVVLLSAGIAFTFSLFTFLFGHRLKAGNSRWLGVTFGILFMAVASFVIATLVSLYSEGSQSKARAVASALGGRLDDAVIFKLNLSDFTGLNEILADYKRLNPDVSAAAIVSENRVLYHTDPKLAGKPWVSGTNVYGIDVSLTGEEAGKIFLAVEIPRSVIYWQVGRSVKNFAALFLASAFFAVLFLELGRALQRLHASRSAGGEIQDSGAAISLVKPAFFLAVFLENLTYAFLPQFMRDVVADYGISSAYTSAPFMAYYLCFAIALLPAGRLESRIGSRKLIVGGLLLSGVTYIVMATTPSFPMIMLARALAGIGQGALFIGVQSYTLANSSPDRRTEAAGIIVFGYQAGMLSGMAIGSLLISHLGVTGVFTLGAVVALVASVYTLIAVPANAPLEQHAPIVERSRGIARDFLDMLCDRQFLRVMCLIGVPAKAVMTGVILFALPLLMSKQGFAQEDLGQIIMLYAVSVVLVSNFAAKYVDRSGGVESVLFWGALLSGVGMLFIAGGVWSPALDWRVAPHLATAALIVGVCVIGVAHGLVNAPVITHVADAPIAARLGASSVAANYRFVERVGHVTGPVIISVMFATFGQNWSMLCWVAGGVCVMAFLFLSTARSMNVSGYNAEVSK